MQIVRTNGRRYKYDSIILNEGTILNGVILDTDEIVRKLREQQKKLKNVTLVVDSSNVMVKKIQTPKLSKKKLLGVVKGEFELGEGHEYVYDMNVLSKTKKEQVVLGCAVPKEFLEKYLATFKEAKIKLVRVDVAINGVIKYINKIAAFKGQTFLINVAFGNTLLSLLFENGVYQVSNRNRMFNDPGSEGYVAELYTKFSTMVQFSQSQGATEPITQSYYIGIDGKTMRSFIQYAKMNDPDITIESYKDMDKNMDYIYPLMGDLVNKEDMNLKLIQKVAAKAKGSKKGIVLKALVLILFCVPFVLYSRQLAGENAKTQSELDALQTYITAREESNANSEDSLSGNDTVLSEIQQYTWVLENIEECKYLTPDMLSDIYSGDVTVESLNYAEGSGTLTISGYGSSQSEVVDYSSGLRENEYADEQYYSGYQVESGEEGSTYHFTINWVWNEVESEEVVDGENE